MECLGCIKGVTAAFIIANVGLGPHRRRPSADVTHESEGMLCRYPAPVNCHKHL